MSPSERLAIDVEIEASKRYQGIVFSRAVKIVMRRKGISTAALARELGVGRPQLRACVERQAAPRNAWQLWPKLVRVLDS